MAFSVLVLVGRSLVTAFDIMCTPCFPTRTRTGKRQNLGLQSGNLRYTPIPIDREGVNIPTIFRDSCRPRAERTHEYA